MYFLIKKRTENKYISSKNLDLTDDIEDALIFNQTTLDNFFVTHSLSIKDWTPIKYVYKEQED